MTKNLTINLRIAITVAFLGALLIGTGVLGIVGMAQSNDAQRDAYALVDCIHYEGMQLRRDIGYHAIARERAGASINDVTDEGRIDALSGNAAFSGTPVVVEAVRSAK